MLDLVQHVAGRPWAIQAEIAAHVRGLVAREGIAGLRHLAGVKQEIHAFDGLGRGGTPARRKPRGIAVIPVIGTLTQRGAVVNSAMTRSTDAVAAEVAEAAGDNQVGSIVLNLDSPGGEVFGVPEAWQAIREARASKPVVAAVNSVAASGGYYLATGADEIWVTPSGMVGSIGVYMLHIDLSKALEEAGERWTFVSAGKFKVEGNPAEPLESAARAEIQREVNVYYDLFVDAVARGRRVRQRDVRHGFGEGRMLPAFRAVAEGMADQVGTVQDAIRRASQLAGDDFARARQARRESKADAQALAARNDASRKLAQLDGRVSSRGLTPDQEAWAAAYDQEQEQRRQDEALRQDALRRLAELG